MRRKFLIFVFVSFICHLVFFTLFSFVILRFLIHIFHWEILHISFSHFNILLQISYIDRSLLFFTCSHYLCSWSQYSYLFRLSLLSFFACFIFLSFLVLSSLSFSLLYSTCIINTVYYLSVTILYILPELSNVLSHTFLLIWFLLFKICFLGTLNHLKSQAPLDLCHRRPPCYYIYQITYLS